MCNYAITELDAPEGSVGLGYYALLLAITRNMDEENRLKKILDSLNLKCVVTEVGGTSDQDFNPKTTKSVLGAALNSNIIGKNARAIHAVLHATEEAKKGVLVNHTSTTNLAVKIAIVRNKEWLAVAIFGQSSLHPYSYHERVGLGVMHMP